MKPNFANDDLAIRTFKVTTIDKQLIRLKSKGTISKLISNILSLNASGTLVRNF